MRRDFEGGVYWDEFAETCGDISRVAGFRGAARFRENMVSEIHVPSIFEVMSMLMQA